MSAFITLQLLHVQYVFTFLVLCAAVSYSLPETVVEVIDLLPRVISSPNFPQCCQPMQYILKKEVDKKYLKLLFTDLDLPPTSQLLVYGLEANGTKVPLESAKYINGEWMRPVVLYEGKQILVEFQTSESSANTSTFVGFNGTFWADDDPWEANRPLTDCPPIGNAIAGGKVALTNVRPLIGRQNYQLYCVWQLKPIPDSDLSIYVNVLEMSGADSKLEIHTGVTSASPIIHSSSEIDSPLKFESTNGFYVKLTRPLEGGDFILTHGVFKSTSSSGDCSFKFEGESVNGFRCGEVDSAICIPVGNKCNSIRDCPAGEDEPETCVKLTTTPAPAFLRTEIEPCPRGRCLDGQCPETDRERCPEEDCEERYRRCDGTLLCVKDGFENCPGEPCARHQRSCADGSCLHKWRGNCSDGSDACGYLETRCDDGRCHDLPYTCPEDEVCYGYYCDQYCHDESIRCNGRNDCRYHEDEKDCPSFSKASKKYLYLLLLIFLLIPLVCFIHYGSKKGWWKERPAYHDYYYNSRQGVHDCPHDEVILE